MSFRRRLLLPIYLLAAGFAQAGEPLLLHAAQARALGIETAAVGALAHHSAFLRGGTLPARVVVPNAQLRVVAAPVAGLIAELAVAPGDAVQRGQVLARLLSPQALELQRDAAQAASQATLLQQNRKRDEALFAEGLIPEARLQASRAAAGQAVALAGERRQGLLLAGATANQAGGRLALTAPLDGVVLEQGAQLGERVEAARLIYRIGQLAPLGLEIEAPVELAAGLRVGAAVQVAGGPAGGRLVAIGRAVTAASQSVLLRAEITTGADTLRPGQVVEAAIAAPSGAGRSVPAGALTRHAGQTLAFVQSAGDEDALRFEARPVRIVSQGGERAVIEGVKDQERIAIKGVSGLKALLSGMGGE